MQESLIGRALANFAGSALSGALAALGSLAAGAVAAAYAPEASALAVYFLAAAAALAGWFGRAFPPRWDREGEPAGPEWVFWWLAGPAAAGAGYALGLAVAAKACWGVLFGLARGM